MPVQETIAQYIDQESDVNFIATCPISHPSRAVEANAYYFGHPQWAKGYFDCCHRDEAFKSRWQAATGSWNDKIVVDIGCGPGNVYAS